MAAAERQADVTWEGNLTEGRGTIDSVTSGALGSLPITWAARVERADGRTSPEELLAAAHAACYAMSLANTLNRAGTPAQRLHISAVCGIERPQGGLTISTMALTAQGWVPGIDQATFAETARTAEQNCPVSKALRNNVQISVTAQLEQ
jgi:lipoyl-dependent peroxiredoxin